MNSRLEQNTPRKAELASGFKTFFSKVKLQEERFMNRLADQRYDDIGRASSWRWYHIGRLALENMDTARFRTALRTLQKQNARGYVSGLVREAIRADPHDAFSLQSESLTAFVSMMRDDGNAGRAVGVLMRELMKGQDRLDALVVPANFLEGTVASYDDGLGNYKRVYAALCEGLYEFVSKERERYERSYSPIADGETLFLMIHVDSILSGARKKLQEMRKETGPEPQSIPPSRLQQLISPLLQAMARPIHSTDPKYDSINPNNVKRWHDVCVESFEMRRHARLWDALNMLFQIPYWDIWNGQEALDTLVQLYWRARKNEHPAAPYLEERIFSYLMEYILESNSSQKTGMVARAFLLKGIEGEDPIRDTENMTSILSDMVREHASVEPEKRKEYVQLCLESLKLVRELLDSYRGSEELPVDDQKSMIRLGVVLQNLNVLNAKLTLLTSSQAPIIEPFALAN